MTEAQVFEAVGRKQMALELVQADYARLVAVLRSIKAGEIALNRVAVNPDGTWAVGPEVKEPESVSA